MADCVAGENVGCSTDLIGRVPLLICCMHQSMVLVACHVMMMWFRDGHGYSNIRTDVSVRISM